MISLRDHMQSLAAHKRTALIVYITQADPNPASTLEIVRAAADAGADVVELGVPFSDPSADGIVIQEAMQRALRAGGGLSSALDGVAELRAGGCDVPIVLFGYYNPIFVCGVGAFAARAEAAGVNAVLTVDVPLDELGELHGPLSQHSIGVVPLIAPTSGEDRVEKIARFAPPFVYYISMTGVTGSAFRGAAGGPERVAMIRERAQAPVAVGFGIKTPDDARRVAAYADGVVVGSAIVRAIDDAGPARAALAVAKLVAELRSGVDG